VIGRFKLLTDEHWSEAHRSAAEKAGWEVVRIVDVLGLGTLDPGVLAHCVEHGLVWVTSDEAARGHVTEWINSGKTLPGVIIGPQRHRISPGRFVRFLEKLAEEENPFASVIRYIAAEDE
jgi:hypothetical protein